MRPRDVLLFYHDGGFVGAGVVGVTIDDPAVGESLWDNPESRFVFTVTDYRAEGPDIDRVWSALGYNGEPRVQGFLRVKDERVERLRSVMGSLRAALFGGDDTTETSHSTAEDRDQLVDELHADSPERRTTTVDRLVRDEQRVHALKAEYDCRCQVCGQRRQRSADIGYAEVHHIKPLGDPHGGPDTRANMLVLCPNHHADFDNGLIRVDPQTLELRHAYEGSISGRPLRVGDDHRLSTQSLEYHNERIATW